MARLVAKLVGRMDLWELKSLPSDFALYSNSIALHFPSFISFAVAPPPHLVYQKEEKRKMRISKPLLFPYDIYFMFTEETKILHSVETEFKMNLNLRIILRKFGFYIYNLWAKCVFFSRRKHELYEAH